MIDHTPTDEQILIRDTLRDTDDNVIINALAGTGKTTTLEMLEDVIIARQASVNNPNILYLAFNKANAVSATKRMRGTTKCKTFNGLGHGIWANTIPSHLTLDPKKSQTIFREIVNESPKSAQGAMWEVYWDVITAVGLAKALGYVPEHKYPNARRLLTQGDFHAALDEEPDELTSDLIDTILVRSIFQAYKGTIDFNDQIYMPALFGGTFPRFPTVKVDELQDLNPTNLAMLDKLVTRRLIGVGDPWQNIYAFRGAKQGGMRETRDKFKMTECDLSISFRCPQAIVENARWRVPHFKWIKEGGHVELLQNLSPSSISDDAAVICRNNAPLFGCALLLLASGRSVSVAGSDVGPKVVNIMKKLGDESMDRDSLLAAIEDWRAEKLAKESKGADDLADCMKVFASHATSLAQAIAYAEHLFAQKGTIRCLTGHKSKGLEFPTVYHLDPWLVGDNEQDKNLRYVIQTRSLDRYYEIDSRDIQW